MWSTVLALFVKEKIEQKMFLTILTVICTVGLIQFKIIKIGLENFKFPRSHISPGQSQSV